MKTILFIGGDARSMYLSELYSESFTVIKSFLGDEKRNIQELIDNSDYIVLPIPFSTDDEKIYSPLSKNKLAIDYLVRMISNKIIICGALKEKYARLFMQNNNKVVDIMKDENLVKKNTIPTAEGVIKIIIENTQVTIDGSRIAILGFGRVGKKVAELLYALKAEIYCFDIKKEEVANIDLSGYNVLKSIDGSLNEMDVIINTVPQKILDKEKFEFINKAALIVDVASKPGGVDFDFARANGYNAIHALGIPGKVAPKTSAMYMKEVIDNIVNGV